MAGSSMAFTYSTLGPIKKVIVDWTSDSATGAVSGTTAPLAGRLVKGITNPGATAPTDDYDIVLSDGESFDVLTNCDDDLANRDTSTTEEVYFLVKDHAGTPLAQSVHPVVCDPIGIAITNAGNSKVGRLVLYLDGLILGQ